MTQKPPPVRVVLAEDGEFIRAGLLALLGDFDEIDVVGVATTYEELIAAVRAHRPDVVLTDVRMPPTLTDEGIRAARELRRSDPGLGVVVLTQYPDVSYALDLLDGGGHGRAYLLKERVADTRELVGALQAVARGESVIDTKVVESLMAAGSRQQSGRLARLTPREKEVLTHIAHGGSNAFIAEQLVLSERSVEKYVGSIFAKLELSEDAMLNRRVSAALMFLNEAGGASAVDSAAG